MWNDSARIRVAPITKHNVEQYGHTHNDQFEVQKGCSAQVVQKHHMHLKCCISTFIHHWPSIINLLKRLIHGYLNKTNSLLTTLQIRLLEPANPWQSLYRKNKHGYYAGTYPIYARNGVFGMQSIDWKSRGIFNAFIPLWVFSAYKK